MEHPKDNDSYMLPRTTLSSVRLTAQHFLWYRQLGWNLHPTIAASLKKSSPSSEEKSESVVAVADIACGNGIWITEEARNHDAKTTRFWGFDVSDVSFPLRETWGENVCFEKMDASGPVATEERERWKGRVDVVHCRLVLGAVRKGDATPWMRGFVDMLKPGGWLQWDEVDVGRMTVIGKERERGGGEVKWESFAVDMLKQGRPGEKKFEWLADREGLLRDHGLEGVVEEGGGEPKMELRQYWTDNEFAVMGEMASAMGARPEVFKQLADGRQQGFDAHFEIKVAIGRKPL